MQSCEVAKFGRQRPNFRKLRNIETSQLLLTSCRKYMNRLDAVEKTQLRDNIPAFQSGDTVKVHVRIKEGNKERIQIFEGVVIARKHGGARETVTVRKVSFGVGVERIFPLHATVVDHIDVVRRGRVRRAKLYYLRELRGKAARIKEKDTRNKGAKSAK